MKVNALLAKQLDDAGVDVVFGLAGNANLSFIYSLIYEHGIRFVSAAHESSAVLMADGYARRTGKVAVATVTQGPGVTNTITALVEASRNRTALVVVAGASPSTDRTDHNVSRLQGTSAGGVRQGINQRDLVLSTGAGFDAVLSAQSAVRDISLAIQRAEEERRPIVLQVPVDLGEEDFPFDYPIRSRDDSSRHESQQVTPDPTIMDRAVGLIASALRPVVLAGRGAIPARASLLRLAERIGAPIATTVLAKDLFRGEPFDLGIFGTCATDVCNEVISEADAVIAFGAGLNPYTTASGGMLSGKRVVQCDLDPLRISRFGLADVGVVGDAAQIADTMVAWLDEADMHLTGWRTPGLAGRLELGADLEFQDLSTESTIDLRSFLRWADDALPCDRLVVVDGGRSGFQAIKHLHVASPTNFLFSYFGSIGVGPSLAIGASLAAPDSLTVAIVGDGGFMMGGVVEFSTAVRMRANLIVIVCNDGSYGAEYSHLRNSGRNVSFGLGGADEGKYDEVVRFGWPELRTVAEVMGGTGVTVRNKDDLPALKAALDRRIGPLLVDVKLDVRAVPEVSH